ncbi:hypothetical protein KAR48_20285 [bacterium]|nr:hypothetical protein [bacterium]
MDVCIDKILIERFVLNDIADICQVREIEAHIASCVYCRQYHAELCNFYNGVEAADISEVREMTERILEKVMGEQPSLDSSGRKPVKLYPIKSVSKEPQYLLAAETNSVQRFTKISSYCNQEQSILARIMHDVVNDQMTLYLLSSENRSYADCLLTIEDCPDDFIVEQDGKVTLKGIDRAGLENRALSVKSPLAVFNLAPFLKDNIYIDGQFSIKNDDINEIKIEIDEEDGTKKYKVRVVNLSDTEDQSKVYVVVSQKGRRPLSSQAHQGVAVFEPEDPENVLKIHIY